MPNPGESATGATMGAVIPDGSSGYSHTNSILTDIEEMLAKEDVYDTCRNLNDFPALQLIENSFYEALSKNNAPPGPMLVYSGSSSNNGNTRSVESSGIIDLDVPAEENPWAVQFRRGLEEAGKFLPASIDFQNINTQPSLLVDVRGHRRKDRWLHTEEGRREKKHLATYEEEEELSKLFDTLFVNPKVQKLPHNRVVDQILLELNSSCKQLPLISGGKSRKAECLGDNNTAAVDLETLLFRCARAVAAGDRVTSDKLLKKVRENSSPFGTGIHRCVHYFSHAIEARWVDIEPETSVALDSKLPSDFHVMKAYETLAVACPYRRVGFYFGTQHLLNLAEKASTSTLHIIDFGILNGFRWIDVIQLLSARPGGPPKLRITGIEHPQPGFRPEEMLEKAGHHLAKYCKRFNVPFEYNGITSQSWHKISIEDLKVDPNDVTVVGSTIRLERILDEIDEEDSPRNGVLSLIRQINPTIFIFCTSNGSHGTPLFFSRFRAAFFYYLTWFDMLDSNFERDNQDRVMIERHYLGRNVLNVLACEGAKRVERPETYKQWQQRIGRFGFRQLPLDRELMTALGAMVKAGYHKEFLLSEDENWMLQGWKGRILFASCCWVPA